MFRLSRPKTGENINQVCSKNRKVIDIFHKTKNFIAIFLQPEVGLTRFCFETTVCIRLHDSVLSDFKKNTPQVLSHFKFGRR